MDSTLYDPTAGSGVTVQRVMSPSGAVYRSQFGDGYYQSWAQNFPKGWKFVVTLDFKNNSLEAATQEAVAAVKLAGVERIEAFELGNEVSCPKVVYLDRGAGGLTIVLLPAKSLSGKHWVQLHERVRLEVENVDFAHR